MKGFFGGVRKGERVGEKGDKGWIKGSNEEGVEGKVGRGKGERVGEKGRDALL